MKRLFVYAPMARLVVYAALVLSACAGQQIDAGRCASVVLEAARNVAMECLMETDQFCPIPEIDDGHGDF